MSLAPPLLDISALEVQLGHRQLGVRGGPSTILADVSLEVSRGEVVGIIGETGSGKTTLARTIVGLNRPVKGMIQFEGRTISALEGKELREFRRSGAIQLVLQDPLRSLDPGLTVEEIVGEGLALRGRTIGDERHARILQALQLVGLGADLAVRRPAEISGGQRQRVSIARSLVVEPRLLICDEPVSALDGSTRNYLLTILADLRRELGVALVVISHDLGSLSGIADRIAVLYQGRIVEDGPLEEVFNRPRHPYTALLVASGPQIGRGWSSFDQPVAELRIVKRPAVLPAGDGCVYAPRCPFADQACTIGSPPLAEEHPGHRVACVHAATWRSASRDEAPHHLESLSC